MSITIKKPVNNQEFSLETPIQFEGIADDGIVSITLVSPFGDREYSLNTIPVNEGKWTIFCPFKNGGERRVIARGFDTANTLVDDAEVKIRLFDTKPVAFDKLVNIPGNINPGLTSAKHDLMMTVLGKPGALTANCSGITNSTLQSLLITSDVGPFRVTGLRPAVEALQRIFSKVQHEKPELFKQLGTAGMTCCRRIRTRPPQPTSSRFSNHSWGTAIDIKISGELDDVGDGLTQYGLLEIASYFNAEGFFWGAGFKPQRFEDSMHFEASTELIQKWQSAGLLG